MLGGSEGRGRGRGGVGGGRRGRRNRMTAKCVSREGRYGLKGQKSKALRSNLFRKGQGQCGHSTPGPMAVLFFKVVSGRRT